MSSSWGGQTVVSGGSVKWGVVFSTVVGAPAYAYFHGITSTVQLVGNGIENLFDGFGEFWTTFFDNLLSEPAYSLERSFFNAVATFDGSGPFQYLLAVGLFLAVAWLVLTGVRTLV